MHYNISFEKFNSTQYEAELLPFLHTKEKIEKMFLDLTDADVKNIFPDMLITKAELVEEDPSFDVKKYYLLHKYIADVLPTSLNILLDSNSYGGITGLVEGLWESLADYEEEYPVLEKLKQLHKDYGNLGNNFDIENTYVPGYIKVTDIKVLYDALNNIDLDEDEIYKQTLLAVFMYAINEHADLLYEISF